MTCRTIRWLPRSSPNARVLILGPRKGWRLHSGRSATLIGKCAVALASEKEQRRREEIVAEAAELESGRLVRLARAFSEPLAGTHRYCRGFLCGRAIRARLHRGNNAPGPQGLRAGKLSAPLGFGGGKALRPLAQYPPLLPSAHPRTD